jgi:two-component system, chemotaxis family, CheB/CheR fusion protein
VRMRPYRTRENKIDGAVIVLIDIDELRQAMEVVMGMVHEPLLMLGLDLKVRSVNAAFAAEFGLRPEDLLGRLIYDMHDKEWDLPHLKALLEEVLPRKRQVADFLIEGHFSLGGFRRLKVTGSRFFEEGKGVPLILLRFEAGAPR